MPRGNYNLDHWLPRWFVKAAWFWQTRGRMVKWTLKYTTIFMAGYSLHVIITHIAKGC